MPLDDTVASNLLLAVAALNAEVQALKNCLEPLVEFVGKQQTINCDNLGINQRMLDMLQEFEKRISDLEQSSTPK